MKIIENNTEFLVVEGEYEGARQVFRMWKRDGKVEVRFNDEFARANGYGNLTEMVIREGMTEWLADNGGVPEWVEWQDGDFVIKRREKGN